MDVGTKKNPHGCHRCPLDAIRKAYQQLAWYILHRFLEDVYLILLKSENHSLKPWRGR